MGDVAGDRPDSEVADESVRDDSPPAGWLAVVAPLIVAVLSFVVFIPALSSGFVWDDEPLLLNVTGYRGVGPGNLRWMFTTLHTGHYMPVVWLSWAADFVVWQRRAPGYHLTNLVLHSINAVLFYYLAKRLLTLAVAGVGEAAVRVCAMAAALLFAVHPLRVESVVWISERKDLLSGLFLLLCLLAYLRAQTEPGGRRAWLAWALVAYVLAVLSKSMVVSLPLVLVVLDVYPLGRLQGPVRQWFARPARRVWLEKLPFAVVALGGAALAVIAARWVGVLHPSQVQHVSARIAQCAYGLAFYVRKSVWPAGLAPLYEMPAKLELAAWPFLLSAQAVLVAAAVLIAVRRRWPAGLATAVFYAIMLAPVLGIVPVGPQITADRYSYLPCLPWAVLAGGGLLAAWCSFTKGRLARPALGAVVCVAAAAIVVLGSLTWRQSAYWHDSVTLWSRCLQVDPKSAIAHVNLGVARRVGGQLDEAIQSLQEAVRLDPNYAKAHFNLGDCLLEAGRQQQGLRHLRRTVELAPRSANAHNTLGNALDAMGRFDEAVEHYTQAARLAPSDLAPRLNVIRVLLKQDRAEAAIEQARLAVQSYPNVPEARYQLARALLQAGNGSEAVLELEQALRHDPRHEGAYRELSRALASLGKYDEAIAALRRGLAELRGSVRLSYDLALMLADCPDERFRDGAEALQLARELAEASSYRHPQILKALAAAHAAVGELDQAIGAAEQARELASEQNNTALRDEVVADLERYRSRRIVSDSPD